eukprot:GEZU01023862.1.p1 GENE.GEZU01023862.1~~GEZU01023862.1.p1  ORF type:complete len:684 (+),score=174.58 GEZU01023862.1:231-2282(+)
MMNKLRNRKSYKFQYDITIHYLMNIPRDDFIMYLTWRRGKKRQGGTKKTFVKDKIAVWEEEISFKGTLFKEGNSATFKKKFINMSISEYLPSKKKDKVVGTLNINLADFSNPFQEFTKTQLFNVAMFNKPDVQLKLTIKSRWLKDERKNKEDSGSYVSEMTTATDATESDGDDDGDYNDDDESSGRSSRSENNNSNRVRYSSSSNRSVPLPRDRGDDDDDHSDASGLSDDEDKPTRRTPIAVDAVDDDEDNGGYDPFKKATPKKKPELGKRGNNDGKQLKFFKAREAAMGDDEDGKGTCRADAGRSRSPTKGDKINGEDEDEYKDAVKRITQQNKELESLKRQLAARQREEEERQIIDTLILFIEPTYSNGVPVSAPIIFRVLKHWNCFTPNQQSFLSKVTKAIEQVVQTRSHDNELLSYWLSNTCVFLSLIQHDFPVSLDDDDEFASKNKKSQRSDKAFMRVEVSDNKQAGTGSAGAAPDANGNFALPSYGQDSDEFEFENPVSQFKNDSKLLSYKVYGFLLKNIYTQLSSILIPSMFQKSIVDSDGKRVTMTAGNMLNILSTFMQYFKDSHMYKEVISQFFAQVLYFINSHMFNSLVTRPELCSMGHAIQMKMSVTRLEEWCDRMDLPPSTKAKLAHLRQAADIMIMNKAALVEEAVRKEVCPLLNMVQVRKLLETYHPDE